MVAGRSLFLDVDGVYGAFDEHVEALFGAVPRDLGDERMWQLVEDTPHFWTHMPLKDGAMALWEAVRHLSPTFLTGCPRTGYERAAEHKVIWVRQHFGDAPVIACLSRDKQLHMRRPGDVLLDDRHSNIRRWEKAGGFAVLYRNPEQAIRDVLRHF